MRARQDRPDPLTYLEAGRATRHRQNRTPAVVDRARAQLEHGPFGRTDGIDGPVWAKEYMLRRIVDMADEDEPTDQARRPPADAGAGPRGRG